MATSDGGSMLSGIAAILAAVTWPVIVLILVLRFAEPLRQFLRNVSELTFRGAGVEATIRARVDAAVAVGNAVTARSAQSGIAPQAAAAESKVAAHNVMDIIRPWMLRRLRPAASVCWVDDRPANNVFERQALEALGIRITEVTSTSDASDLLKRRRFGVVISDMDRPPDARAGFTLLDELQNRRDRTPVVFYVGEQADSIRREAQQRGVVGVTNRPDELLQMVVDALVEIPSQV